MVTDMAMGIQNHKKKRSLCMEMGILSQRKRRSMGIQSLKKLITTETLSQRKKNPTVMVMATGTEKNHK